MWPDWYRTRDLWLFHSQPVFDSSKGCNSNMFHYYGIIPVILESKWLHLRVFHFFYAQPQKVAGYYVIPSELLSVRLSVRPSAVDHSYPLNNFDTIRDNFTKLGTNIKHDQTTSRN